MNAFKRTAITRRQVCGPLQECRASSEPMKPQAWQVYLSREITYLRILRHSAPRCHFRFFDSDNKDLEFPLVFGFGRRGDFLVHGNNLGFLLKRKQGGKPYGNIRILPRIKAATRSSRWVFFRPPSLFFASLLNCRRDLSLPAHPLKRGPYRPGYRGAYPLIKGRSAKQADVLGSVFETHASKPVLHPPVGFR